MIFGVGMNAARSEFRGSRDVNGRPVDAVAETETQRSDRIRALQDRWQPHDIPSAEPNQVFAEWLAASPENRMSAFAKRVAESPELMPQAETEPGQPGGLIERMQEHYRARAARAQRNANR